MTDRGGSKAALRVGSGYGILGELAVQAWFNFNGLCCSAKDERRIRCISTEVGANNISNLVAGLWRPPC